MIWYGYITKSVLGIVILVSITIPRTDVLSHHAEHYIEN